MNEGFFQLPDDRQRQIINAGYKVFSQNTYKKAPVAEIAAEAGISKALLFYHFKNKKELYLFLWKKSLLAIEEQLHAAKVIETDDLFEMLRRSLHGKCEIMRKYPYMSSFSMKAYYEQCPEIVAEIQKDFQIASDDSLAKVLNRIDQSKFSEGTDIAYMYQEMLWAADGFLHMSGVKGDSGTNKIEQDFEKLISFWQQMYLQN